MLVSFVKYHGAGNDFVVVDNRKDLKLSRSQMAAMCHRRFGIGADGVLLLNAHDKLDFGMRYINNDGSEGPMCGNGARCLTHFAKSLGIIQRTARFECNGSTFSSEILTNGLVKVKMLDVTNYYHTPHGMWVDAKTPHLIIFDEHVDESSALTLAPEIRYNPYYGENGTNVNYCRKDDDGLHIITYERGIEDITWACGTGAIAGAAAYVIENNLFGNQRVSMTSKGGKLLVELTYKPELGITNVYMTGPAVEVFSGQIHLEYVKE